jgi:hypothetical protein
VRGASLHRIGQGNPGSGADGARYVCSIAEASAFAQAIASCESTDRESASESAIARVRDAGYDVTTNAKTLSHLYEMLAQEAQT